MAHKKERECYKCCWSFYLESSSVMASGHICYKNPFRPVVMGLFGSCKDRKENMREQYPKKKG